jgi:hypothetical protein
LVKKRNIYKTLCLQKKSIYFSRKKKHNEKKKTKKKKEKKNEIEDVEKTIE